MRLLDAVYINNGGGLRLLELLFKEFRYRPEVTFLVDSRVRKVPDGIKSVILNASETERRRFYKAHAPRLQKVFCFGNVPPPVRLSCPVKTYLHNRLLLKPPALSVSILSVLKWKLKREYLRFRVSNTHSFAVQTESMAVSINQVLSLPFDRVQVWPFYAAGIYTDLAQKLDKSADSFGYVSLPHLYKRHNELLDAWELLAVMGLKPELHLTIPFEHPLTARVEMLKASGLRIVNHGFCDPRVIYSRCQFQIFPSSTESFGLGLIEAAEAGCSIIAPDLPYVQAVVDPSLTWPSSDGAAAIAKAVEIALTKPLAHSSILVENKLNEIVSFMTQ